MPCLEGERRERGERGEGGERDFIASFSIIIFLLLFSFSLYTVVFSSDRSYIRTE